VEINNVVDTLREIEARPRRYENIDGTAEMSFGLMILSLTLMGYLGPIVEDHATWPSGLVGFWLLVLGAIAAYILTANVLTRLIKKHITYPRTGYVAYRPITKENRWRTLAFVIGLSAAAAGLASLAPMIQRNHESSALRAVMVLAFLGPYALLVLHVWKDYRWKRYLVLAYAAGLLAIAFLVPGNIEQLARPVMALSSSVWLGSGIATLVAYIRHTQAPIGEE